MPESNIANDLHPADPRKSGKFWCITCKTLHEPSNEHPLCSFAENHLHVPPPEGLYIDFRGWRFTAPFVCMGCGIEVCYIQWAFSRTCGGCDISNSPTRRLRYGAFAGPHTQIQFPIDPREPGALMEADFIDPVGRDRYPVLNPARPLLEIAPTNNESFQRL